MTLNFAGYASLFNVPDAAGDIIAPGAFTRSLARRGSRSIRMLFQHMPEEPVGIWDICRETAAGLYVSGRLLQGVRRGRDLSELVAARAIDGLSIGFRVVKANRDRATGRRIIAEADLWEISIVTFPMLDGARIARAA